MEAKGSDKRMNIKQKYSSAATSINSKKVPVLFKKIKFKPGTSNLDYGAGKWDTASQFLESLGVINYPYDPYNRTEEENNVALSKTDYDTATLSNVLNVISEREIRHQILKDIKAHVKDGGIIYISVYEGDGSSKIKYNEKKNSCQLNKPLKDYIFDFISVFTRDELWFRNKFLMIKKGGWSKCQIIQKQD